MGQTEIVFSGFGGQGVLFAGELLCFAAMSAGRETTWFPSYGPEMRGGTAHCTVIIGDQEIGSPLVDRPEAAVVMNIPSFDRYLEKVRPGGVLVFDSSLIDRASGRADLRLCAIPSTPLAESLGAKRVSNLILVGALLAALPVLSLDQVERAIADSLPERHKKMLPVNIAALRAGYEFGPRRSSAQSEIPAARS